MIHNRLTDLTLDSVLAILTFPKHLIAPLSGCNSNSAHSDFGQSEAQKSDTSIFPSTHQNPPSPLI